MKSARELDIVVMSDLHIGTYGFHAKETLQYLNSIAPKVLILNGDIIDIWNFKTNYFPSKHLKVIHRIIQLSQKDTKVYYITGNHDDLLRKFSNTYFGNIELLDKLVLTIDGKKHWFFHGDVFDASIQHTKWIAKLGGKGYDFLIRINRLINQVCATLGKEPMSFAGKIKNNVKKAVKFISDFEHTAAQLAIENNYDYVVCGHIHMPQVKEIKTSNGSTIYMNSGDWVENLSSLEFVNSTWTIYKHEIVKAQSKSKIRYLLPDEYLVKT